MHTKWAFSARYIDTKEERPRWTSCSAGTARHTSSPRRSGKWRRRTRTGNLVTMRFLLGLLLVLVLVPAGGFLAPCCADALSEACCPVDRACDEGPSCPATTHFTAVRTAPAGAVLPPPPVPPLLESARFVRLKPPACPALVPLRLVILRN